MIRIALIAMWLLHWLPMPVLAFMGRMFGRLLFYFGSERRNVTLTNLRMCFPNMSELDRTTYARAHFEWFGRSFLERGVLWWASPARIKKLVRVEGMENLNKLKSKPVILLVPHFVGLDTGWTRLTLELDMVSIYANQKNMLFNAALLQGRTRFGNSILLSRQAGTRQALRAMKSGKPFYYLPDMDYGERDTIFVPFFGVQAATITGLSRLARLAGAAVIPVITKMNENGYTVSIQSAWENYPSENIEADTKRMNEFIEAEVLKNPLQYFWLHKRFKTRPQGEERVY